MCKLVDGLDLKLTILTFLAILGVIFIFQNIVALLFNKQTVIQMNGIVLAVRDAQDYIEGLVENIFRQPRADQIEELWVVDCGSSDYTAEILERLSLRFSGLKVAYFKDIVPKEAFKEIIDITNRSRIFFMDLTSLRPDEIKNRHFFYAIKKTSEWV